MKVFVTGSSRGLGLEIAKAFRRKGYDIVLNGRSGLNFKTDWEYCQAHQEELFAEDFAEYGVDVVVNNAFNKSDCIGSLAGQIHVLQEALKYFDDKGGIIVNINSSKGIVPDVDFPEYAAAKYGLRGYSESVKFQAYKKSIHIIDLYPGAINVGMSDYREDIDELIDAKELSDEIVHQCESKKYIASTIHFNRKCYPKDQNK